MKSDALKKHHFWILFGLVPLLVLIAVVVINSSVGGAIEKREGEVEKEKKDIASKTNPKSEELIKKMESTIQVVDGKRGGLWKENWDLQKDLYVWPRSSLFQNFKAKVKGEGDKDKEVPVERLEDLKFGTPLVANDSQFDEFRKKEFYLALYSNADPAKGFAGTGMADRIAPTQFLGGWQSILRHVNAWSDYAISSDQVWLMMEDVWVQRSLLEAIKSVNDQMSEFRRVKYEKGGQVIDDPDPKAGRSDPLRRKFQSRTWDVALEVVNKGGKPYLTGTLTNITERLQVLGIGKKMRLKVWLEPGRDGKGAGVEPVEFVFDSEFLPGKGGKRPSRDKDGREIQVDSNVTTMQPDENNPKELDKYPNLLPPGKNVTEIVKVEQVFDTQTVPIRRIDALALGFMDSRWTARGVLAPPKFINLEAPAAAAGDPNAGGFPGGPQPGGPQPGGLPPGGLQPGGPGGDRMGGGPGAAGASTLWGGGPITTVVDANKRRYIDVTDQVRRMPVGLVVVVDQSYLQDVLLSLANSQLRFQVTQVTWKRFRGTLGTGSSEGGYGQPGGGGNILLGGGSLGSEFNRGGSGDAERRGRMPGPSLGPGPGPLQPGTIGSAAGPPGGGAPGPGSAQPGGYGSGYGGYGGYGGEGSSMTSVSEAQLTSGLIELSVYGVVTLYEKYTPPADPEAKDKDVKEGDPKEKEKDKDPMPATPTPTTPPKSRVRRRRAA